MLSICLIGVLVVLVTLNIIKKFIKIPKISRVGSDGGRLGRWKKSGIITWKIIVIGYGMWLLLNFWKVIVFPATPITIEQITNIIFHPPFIQLILAVTYAWLIIALLNAPAMHLKGINTPFLRFEMDKIEEIVLQGDADLAASRESDEIRWIAVNLATKVNPYNDVDSNEVVSGIELFAKAMGGVILDAFRTIHEEVEFESGIVTIERGELNDDIWYFPPEAQYVMRNAYGNNSFYYKGMSLAVPIRFEETEAIFYMYNSLVQIYKMDCMMVETIWDILRQRPPLEETGACGNVDNVSCP